jgi:hypothetical protein
MFAKDTTVRMRMTTPDGAPAPNGVEFVIDDNVGIYPTFKSMHTDCRLFVKQKERSLITCHIDEVFSHLSDERIVLDGLKDAQVTFYPIKGSEIVVRATRDIYNGSNIEFFFDEARGCYVIPHATGTISIGWSEPDYIGDYKKLEFLRDES